MLNIVDKLLYIPFITYRATVYLIKGMYKIDTHLFVKWNQQNNLVVLEGDITRKGYLVYHYKKM